MSELRKGQKIRVTYEAEYDRSEDGAWKGWHRVVTVDPRDGSSVFPLVPGDATIEPIEDLQPGDVYRDEENDLCVYIGGDYPWMPLTITGKVRPGQSTNPVSDRVPARPLTLLVRNGQPVIS